jgi:quercetin dioxygenase-like cupin family protein
MFRITTLALIAAFSVAPALAEESISYKTLVTPLIETSRTIIDQPIAYPAGTAKVTAVIVTIPRGGETGWHEHAVPLFGYMLDGELTVDYGDKGTRTYKPGDTLMEAMNWPHNGTNKGDAPVRILAVYMGADGIPNATTVPHP